MTELISNQSKLDSELLNKAADQKYCFSCSTILHSSAQTCPKCGAVQPQQSPIAHIPSTSHAPVLTQEKLPPNHVYCRGCGQAIHESAHSCPKCGAVQKTSYFATRSSSGLDRMTTALLAFFLGGFGAHKFYLGQTGMGIVYLLFCWTFIPAIVAFIEGIIFLTMSDAEFNAKY